MRDVSNKAMPSVVFRKVVQHCLSVLFLSFSIVYMLGWRDFEEISCSSIVATYVLFIMSMMGITFLIIHFMNSKNAILSVLLVLSVVLSFGFWVVFPSNWLISISMAVNQSNLFILGNSLRTLLFVFQVSTCILLILHVRRSYLLSNQKKYFILYLCFLLFSSTIQMIGTFAHSIAFGSGISEFFQKVISGHIGEHPIFYWMIMFFRQDVLIYLSFGYIIYALRPTMGEHEKIKSNGNRSHFIFLWLVFGIFGIERLVSRNKYFITYFQSVSTIVILVLHILLGKYCISYAMNPPLYVFVFVLVPLFKGYAWLFSFLNKNLSN